eukprot:Opistho-2@13522
MQIVNCAYIQFNNKVDVRSGVPCARRGGDTMDAIVFELTPAGSITACLAFTALFVGSLYIWKTPLNRHRDSPDVIKKRFVSVSLVVILAPLILALAFGTRAHEGSKNGHTLAHWMGFRGDNAIVASALPLFLTAILFVGPLVMDYADGELREKLLDHSPRDLIFMRNIIVGPVTEEIVFRGCMIPLLVSAVGPGWAILLNPLFFGFAHTHHILHILHAQGTPVGQALIVVAVQLFYTSVFGLYSAFLLVRTGSIFGPIVSHIFCNMMGFPRFGEISEHKHSIGTHWVDGRWLSVLHTSQHIRARMMLYVGTSRSQCRRRHVTIPTNYMKTEMDAGWRCGLSLLWASCRSAFSCIHLHTPHSTIPNLWHGHPTTKP